MPPFYHLAQSFRSPLYVTNRAIQNRLDDVFGVFGWQNEFKEWKNTSQICGISVWYDEKQQWVTKWDGADDSQMEAVKGGLSDAMKRAACQWGIGRYLYNLEAVWVPIKQSGKSYVLVEEPPLPQWALPKDYQRQSKPHVVKPPHEAGQTETHHVPLSQQGNEKNLLERAKRAGITEQQLLEKIQKTWQIKSIAELTDGQYRALVKKLDALALQRSVS